MNGIYFDNGSTSFPKAPGVGEAMAELLTSHGFNINRGGYESAYEVSDKVMDVREKLCSLFGASKSRNVIFTPNVTCSLNYIIKGLLHTGDHVVISSLEHNAVMRPLVQMQHRGVHFDAALADEQGNLTVEAVEQLIQKNTRAVIMTHASNVCGTILPVQKVAQLCKERGILFILDTAQTAGSVVIDLHKIPADALCFTGHKGLLGPQGIGGMILSDQLAQELEPVISGGTGSVSDSEEMPSYLPDRFEAGTPNLPGIAGLGRALDYLEHISVERIHQKEMELTSHFLQGILPIEGVRLVGRPEPEGRTAIVSLDFPGRDNAQISYLLDNRYRIMTRCGLHCAPRAHKTLHTFPQGTVRFGLGYFNTVQQVDTALEAICEIVKGK